MARLLGESVDVVEPIGQLFVRLLMAAAIPLVIFNLLAGLTTLTELRTFGRLAAKIVAYYVVTTAFALSLGLGVMSVLRPGDGIQLTEPVPPAIGEVPSLGDVLVDLVPSNVFEALAEGKVAQLVVFTILLGITTLLLPPEPRDKLRAAYALGAELFRKLVEVILKVAPIGIGALMAVTVGRYGAELFGPLARFIGGVWGAQLGMVLVYMTLLLLLAGRKPAAFLARRRRALGHDDRHDLEPGVADGGLRRGGEDEAPARRLFAHPAARRPDQQGRDVDHAFGGADVHRTGGGDRILGDIDPHDFAGRVAAVGGLREESREAAWSSP